MKGLFYKKVGSTKKIVSDPFYCKEGDCTSVVVQDLATKEFELMSLDYLISNQSTLHKYSGATI